MSSSAELCVYNALRYSTRQWEEMDMLDLEEEMPGVQVYSIQVGEYPQHQR